MMSTRKSLCSVDGVAGVAFDAAVHDLKPGDIQLNASTGDSRDDPPGSQSFPSSVREEPEELTIR
jgi:hypothetical protein